MDDFVAFIVEGILLMIVGILGMVGNLSAITVFARQHLQKNFHALMLSLAVFDLLYIVANFLCFSIPQFSDTYQTSAFYNYILPWVLPLAQVGITGSIYFTMAITVERYVTVCHPFYRVSHSWPAKKMVIPIVTFAIVYNIPKFFELRTKVPGSETDYENELNSTYLNGTMSPPKDNEYGITPTSMRLNDYYYKIYCMWFNFLLMGVGPFLLLIILNALTLIELKNLGNQVSHGPDSVANRNRDLALAKVSLAIVFVFIVCHSIKWIPNIYELLQVDLQDSDRIKWPEWVEITSNISHLMTTFNSSVNFYIYLAKHWRVVLGRPESAASDRTETMRLRTSVVVHNNHHYPPINLHNSGNGRLNGLNHHTSGTHRHDANNLRIISNQSENAVEETKMLVNVLVSAPHDSEINNEESSPKNSKNSGNFPNYNKNSGNQPSALLTPDL